MLEQQRQLGPLLAEGSITEAAQRTGTHETYRTRFCRFCRHVARIPGAGLPRFQHRHHAPTFAPAPAYEPQIKAGEGGDFGVGGASAAWDCGGSDSSSSDSGSSSAAKRQTTR